MPELVSHKLFINILANEEVSIWLTEIQIIQSNLTRCSDFSLVIVYFIPKYF